MTDQRLMILDYDSTKNHGKYRALVNEEQVAVLQLQLHHQDGKKTPLSQLSLCPGLQESEVLQLLSPDSVTKKYLVQICIEKIGDDIVYRYWGSGAAIDHS